MFGLNMIRLHQKVNPERWYYHADRLGVLVFQDMVQKCKNNRPATAPIWSCAQWCSAAAIRSCDSSERRGLSSHSDGGANDQTIPYFVQDFENMVAGRGNHPSIVQFETFNEGGAPPHNMDYNPTGWP